MLVLPESSPWSITGALVLGQITWREYSGCQLFPWALSSFQTSNPSTQLTSNKNNLTQSLRFAVKSACTEEGLGYRKSCLTEAVQLRRRDNCLATLLPFIKWVHWTQWFLMSLSSKLYFWIFLVHSCTWFGQWKRKWLRKAMEEVWGWLRLS